MIQQCNNMESHGIWVVAEQNEGKVTSVSYELLSKARELQKQLGFGEPVTAVLLGEGLSGFSAGLAAAGANQVILADHPGLKNFQNETYSVVLQTLVEEKKPAIVLMGATAAGSDLAPLLGAKLMTGVAAHCMDLRINSDGNLVSVVPAFGGKVLGDILCPERRPQMATVRPGILDKPVLKEGAAFREEAYDPSAALAKDPGRVAALGITRQEVKGVPLEEAEIVIAGGFGVALKEEWALLEELASLLGGSVGCTRPAVDEGLIAESQMIGTSGKSVRPKVYLGAGISGATHHLCGMKDSGLVISINKDEKAPIFDSSDIRIVADAVPILNLLIEKIKGMQ